MFELSGKPEGCCNDETVSWKLWKHGGKDTFHVQRTFHALLIWDGRRGWTLQRKTMTLSASNFQLYEWRLCDKSCVRTFLSQHYAPLLKRLIDITVFYNICTKVCSCLHVSNAVTHALPLPGCWFFFFFFPDFSHLTSSKSALFDAPVVDKTW